MFSKFHSGIQLLLLCTLLNTCTEFGQAKVSIPYNLPNGFVTITAAGKVIPLGVDSGASSEEMPRMYTRFSNDYHLYSHEVRKDEFQKLMGYVPTGAEGDSAVDPVRFVSWYEALYFCNRMSAAHGLDSVYSYTSVTLDSSGKVAGLEGLKVNYSADGIRLPTEAEWVYAAANIPSDSLVPSAWYAENSGGRVHPVEQRRAYDGLYDMAGNVMEWVGDGLGTFPNHDTLTDYAGLVLGESALSERVVKGGSWEHSAEFLDPNKRRDYYPLAGHERLAYLGFRVAEGAIHPSFSSATGSVVKSVNVVLSASTQEVQHFVNRPDFRITFVDQTSGLLYLVGSSLSTIMFPDTGTIAHPTLSPDGNWIAYSNRYEGQSGNGSVYVRNATQPDIQPVKVSSGVMPHWWVDPTSLDTFLVIADVASADDEAGWVGTTTFKLQIQGGQAVGSPVTLTTQGSYHGGLSTDGNTLVTGYRQLFAQNLSTKNVDTLFRYPNNGKPQGASAQVCNVSLSNDQIPQILFLDFGSPQSSSIVGHSYDIHQVLFTMHADGSVLQSVYVPSGVAAWDYPRYANSGHYGIAVGQDANGAGTSLWLVNLDLGTTMQVVLTNDAAFPDLWVSPLAASSGIALDSAGMYDIPNLSAFQQVYNFRMLEFWKYTNTHYYIMGNSQAADDFDGSVFQDSGYDMGVAAFDLKTNYELLKHYLLPQGVPQGLKWIALSIPMDYLNQGITHYAWSLGVSTSTGRLYDSTHGYWSQGAPSGWRDYLAGIHTDPAVAANSNPSGVFLFQAQGWGDLQMAQWAKGVTVNDPNIQESIDTMIAMGKMAAAQGVHFVFVATPQDPAYQAYSMWGPSELPCSTAYAVLDSLRVAAQQNPYLHVLDAHNCGNHDYTDSDAYDLLHLSAAGAHKFSLRLRDSLLSWEIPAQ